MTAVLGGAPGVPTIAIDSVENTVTFNYGSFDDPANQPTAIDILFTVTMQSVPVADGLFLANLAQSRERTTQNVVVANDAIAQVGVTAPLLRISKGAVASNNGSVTFSPTITGPVTFNAPGDPIAFSGVINSSTLATAPVNSDIGDINPGDLIRFAIVIENTGSSPYGAFDISISDNLPPGFQIPPGGSNLTVQYGGAGPAITYTGTDADFFGGGIQLNDPGVNLGVCGPYHATNGLNVIVITYDLLLVTEPNGTVANTASLFNYATAEGGVDATGQQDLTDSAQMFFDFVGGGASGIQISKSADLPFAQPGEVVTWTVVVTNNDPAPAVNIVVEDTIPPQVQVLDVSADMGTIAQSGNTYTLTAAILPPGASITMTIQARLLRTLQAPYEIINRALLFVGGQQIGAAQSNILSAATLPLTGESRYSELRQALGKWIHERLYHS
jgi:uncharacterized repeat protein (TIGR01451 family)